MAVRFRLPPEALRDGSGNILAGGTLSFYDTTTTNLRTIYTDNARGTPAANPYTLDSAGEHDDIFLDNALYRVIIKNAAGSTVPNGDIDPIDGTDTQTADYDLSVTINGGGVTPGTGIIADQKCDITGTIVGWSVEADVAGSAVVDIWKKAFAANSPPTVSDSITASAKPTLSTAQSAASSSLTDWTTAVTAGDTFRFHLDSVSTLTFFTLTLKIRRTLSK